ncbi:glycosyltransferase family 2 protein [Persephonella atlantica]|uniref:Glycosyltransferase family 2 protein n=1 Tax=Persephonella atlantica TaxID=2699429 RepID=A0ABS1GFZ7_9AQUI|nr:glycosyltransferase family 2 protein [Persephonella atlantica]MBK3331845.1 glycosyltransferase family 2 protein [Persephonella atlantica]
MEKISVVIPVYNGEKYIKDAVDSALSQSYENVEVIIINDASTDRTEEVIFQNFGELLGSKVIYHKNPVNRERAYSRNKGVELSSGEYIFFLDYDDKWKTDYLKKSVEYLRDYHIVYSFPKTFIDSEGKILRKSKKSLTSEKEIIFSGQIGYPSATGVRKDSYINYLDRYLIREDWEFFIRAYIQDLKIKILDNDMVLMREHSNRTSRNLQFYKATLTVFRDYYDKVPAKVKADFMFHVGEVCLRFGDLALGWKLILKSLKEKPALIKDKRKALSVLKRGIRIDRAVKLLLNP